MSDTDIQDTALPPAPRIGLFEDNALPLQVSLKRQIACVERELKKRAAVYPRLVAAGKMTQAAAQDEIGAMQAVLMTLRGVQFNTMVVTIHAPGSSSDD